MSALLVIDVGTTGLRAAVVDDALTIRALEYRPCPPSTPAPGLVEFDATVMAALVLDAATAVLQRTGITVDAVGVTTQRASVVVWDRDTGEPVAPGLGWQDLRTIGECMMAKAEHGLTLAPNQSATKVAWILSNTADLEGRNLAAGTVDAWIAWTLTGGAVHASDQTNSSATTNGLRSPDGRSWSRAVCEALGVPLDVLPEVYDTAATFGTADALPGSPPITAMVGDQQASLVGQGCVRPGRAKITFGTGGMLDVCTGRSAPADARRHGAGTYPLPLWSIDGELAWGVEGIMLSAGTNVEWLRDDLGIIESSQASHEVASQCADTGGVVYVPALLGLGTPRWDYGARGTLLGVTRGTERPHVVRAVLEGIAHRGADLVEAARADTGIEIHTVRIDGGMSRNPTFTQAVADAIGAPIEVAPVAESTTIGAAFLAGLGAGVWSSVDDVDRLWQPSAVVEPRADGDRSATRARWADALDRSAGWHADLSALDF